MTDKALTFGVKIPVETNALEGADSVEALRKAITASQDTVKQYASSFRLLKGTSDAVTESKAILKAAMNAERDAISRNVLALGDLGKTVADTTKKAAPLVKVIGEVKTKTEAAKGPAADLSKRFEDLIGKFTGAGAGANIAVLGFGLVAAAILAVTAAAVAGTVALSKFVIEGANELRTFNLLSEAAGGTAENATAMGHQIELLATKVPLSTQALRDLQLELVRGANGTRMSGNAIEDTFNAVAQASGAMGDSAGKAIQEVLTRGKLMGRMGLGVNELQGSGIQFTDVAAQLSKNLKISLREAQTMLVSGRVKLDAGAKAIRDVVETRFAKVNASLMLDLPKQIQKLKDSLVQLTSGVDLAPFLEGFKRIAALFDKSSVSGGILKDLITDFGAIMTKVFVAALPFIEIFFTQLCIEALKLESAFLSLGIWVKKTFGVDFVSSFDLAETAVTAAKVAFASVVIVVGALAIAAALALAPFVALGYAWMKLTEASESWGKSVRKYFLETDWAGMGTAIIDGLVNGITAGFSRVKGAVQGLVDGVKNTFTGSKGIDAHSPSRFFDKQADNSVEGFAGGLEKRAGRASGAVVGLLSGSGKGGAGASARGSIGRVDVTVNMVFPNAKSGADVAQTLNGPSFKAQFTKALEEMLLGMGATTGAPQGDAS